MYGSGGPMSEYAVKIGNNTTSGSSKIEVLSAEKAKDWLEEKNEAEALEEHFGDELEEA